jgi:hypothetical protein
VVAVLKVQGVELDVSVADWEPVRLGAVARSFSGAPRSSVRTTRRSHHFAGDAAGVPVATAEALRGLVEGYGHSWSFDDTEELLTSSRGLAPSETGAVGTGAGKYGTCAQFSAGEAATKWELGLDGGSNTLMYWRKESGVWVHYLVLRATGTSPDGVWRNAVRTDTDPGIVYPEDGNLVVDPNVDGDADLDELVALPFPVPEAWVPSLYSWRSTKAWEPLPFVAASGAAFPGGVVRALGQADTAHRVPLRTAGAFGLGELVAFTLEET